MQKNRFRSHFKLPSLIRGRAFEHFFLGESSPETWNIDSVPNYHFHEGIDRVFSRSMLRGHDKHPPTEPAKELFGEVEAALVMRSIQTTHLRLLSAIGTALDVHYGTDALFLLLINNVRYWIRLDLTVKVDFKLESRRRGVRVWTDPSKKAEFVIRARDLRDPRYLSDLGVAIADAFIEKINQKYK